MRTALLILAITVLANCQAAAFADIETGKITPITTFSGNSTPSSYSYTHTHGISAANILGCLALVSYDAIGSTTFSFNSSITTLASTTLVMQIETFNTTYFNILSYHFLITTHPTLEINLLCYYTSTLNTGSGSRSVVFSNASTAFTGSYRTVFNVISGCKVQNTQGNYFDITTSSTV